MAQSYTADLFGMGIRVPGGMLVKDNTYYGDGSTTLAKGDLCRITTSGQIKDAAVDSTTTGPIHGMVLQDWTTAPTTSQKVIIALFAEDTVLRTQIYNSTGSDAEPQDVAVGVAYTLRNSAAGNWSITTTTTNGIATIVDKEYEGNWFESSAGDDWGVVLVSFAQALLDAHSS